MACAAVRKPADATSPPFTHLELCLATFRLRSATSSQLASEYTVVDFKRTHYLTYIRVTHVYIHRNNVERYFGGRSEGFFWGVGGEAVGDVTRGRHRSAALKAPPAAKMRTTRPVKMNNAEYFLMYVSEVNT